MELVEVNEFFFSNLNLSVVLVFVAGLICAVVLASILDSKSTYRNFLDAAASILSVVGLFLLLADFSTLRELNRNFEVLASSFEQEVKREALEREIAYAFSSYSVRLGLAQQECADIELRRQGVISNWGPPAQETQKRLLLGSLIQTTEELCALFPKMHFLAEKVSTNPYFLKNYSAMVVSSSDTWGGWSNLDLVAELGSNIIQETVDLFSTGYTFNINWAGREEEYQLSEMVSEYIAMDIYDHQNGISEISMPSLIWVLLFVFSIGLELAKFAYSTFGRFTNP